MQDDPHEWKRKALEMVSIYQHPVLPIVTAASFFFERTNLSLLSFLSDAGWVMSCMAKLWCET